MIHELLRGHAAFQTRYATRAKGFLERLASEAQNPGALFIGCSDSRVIPELLTSSSPGELFVMRNVANIVPPFEHSDVCVGASIEYAVAALGVEHIVVCGHTGCGGVHAAMHGGHGLAQMPSVLSWLEIAKPAVAEASGDDEDELWQSAVELNVLHQLEHLGTYPIVAEALAEERIDLHGWVYDMRRARLLIFDPESGLFTSPEL